MEPVLGSGTEHLPFAQGERSGEHCSPADVSDGILTEDVGGQEFAALGGGHLEVRHEEDDLQAGRNRCGDMPISITIADNDTQAAE